MRGLLLLVPFFFVAAACSSSATDAEGDIGAESLGATSAKEEGACTVSRDKLLANASAERANAISRGFAWFDAKVPYSQTADHEGYRTDCSGFVSMCWQLQEPGFTTGDFSGGGAGDTILGSYDDLQPADGFVRRVGGEGHAILFLGWNDDAHTEACTLEEADSALDMQFGIHTVASLQAQSFQPMRNSAFGDNVPQGGSGDDDDSTSADDDDDDATSTQAPTSTGSIIMTPDGPVFSPNPPSSSNSSNIKTVATAAGGARCANDGTCNPGNDGSGLICGSAGTCIPGCHTDIQCPGASACVNGQCQ